MDVVFFFFPLKFPQTRKIIGVVDQTLISQRAVQSERVKGEE